MIIIKLEDYLKNKEKCICGENSFFSRSTNNVTVSLQCKQCSSVYRRDKFKKEFILDER